ncbi:MAG: hypothetical protein IH957_02320 [Chloroflexi bacterium]|nr:hypothetical protein [Chloroflexota bacterium]
MGRPKIDTYWINLVRGFLKTEPRKSAKSIEISLAFIGPRLPKPRDDWPKERTIRDIAKRFGELTPERQQHFERTVGAIVDGVRGGAFPAVSGPEDEFYGGFDNCTYCDFDRICSRRRDDELLEKLGDPDLARWARVAKVARREEAP